MTDYTYEAWHAEVARLVANRHPSANVTHSKQLGGNCNGVVIECGEKTVVVISDDALGIYTREQWYGDEGEDNGDFPYSDVMGTPSEAADRARSYIVAAGC